VGASHLDSSSGPRLDKEEIDPRVARTITVVRRAVLEQLGDVGYGALTIEAVAARSGVAKSTIYRHWNDKLALIADAFEAAHVEHVPNVATGTSRERIERLVAHVAEILVDSTFSRCIPALIEGAAQDPRLRDFHYRYSSERRKGLVGLVAEGVTAGEFASDTNPELAAVALLGAIFYYRLMCPRPFVPQQASQLVRTVLPPASSRRRKTPLLADERS
jgi:TetR/AcrR family transcriptional regulator of autoinduction and epiphytic fitness